MIYDCSQFINDRVLQKWAVYVFAMECFLPVPFAKNPSFCSLAILHFDYCNLTVFAGFLFHCIRLFTWLRMALITSSFPLVAAMMTFLFFCLCSDLHYSTYGAPYICPVLLVLFGWCYMATWKSHSWLNVVFDSGMKYFSPLQGLPYSGKQ